VPHVPFILPPDNIGPQRAAPKSLPAVEAEVKQTKAKMVDDGFLDQPPIIKDVKPRHPFLKKISIKKWKVNANEMARKLGSK
jgi:hypothetical protein